MAVEHVRGAARCVDVEAESLEALADADSLLLVRVADGNQDSALLLHLEACAGQTLEQRLAEALGNAEDLAGGLHLRA